MMKGVFFGSPFSCFLFVVFFLPSSSFFSYSSVQRFPEMKMILFVKCVCAHIGNICLLKNYLFLEKTRKFYNRKLKTSLDLHQKTSLDNSFAKFSHPYNKNKQINKN